MRSSENIDKLATAMAAFQAELQDPSRDAQNPRLKNKYVSLQQALHVARPQLSKHGLSIVQLPTSDGERVGVTTRLMHSSGQWLEESAFLPLWSAPGGVNVAQIMGMAISYLRRYSILAVAGFAHDDDDAESVPAGRAEQKPAGPQPMAARSPEREALRKYLTEVYAPAVGLEKITGPEVDKLCEAHAGKKWAELTESDGARLQVALCNVVEWNSGCSGKATETQTINAVGKRGEA